MKITLFLSVFLLLSVQLSFSEIIYGETGLFALGSGSSVARAPDPLPSPVAMTVCPNPFNPSTAITIALQGKITVSIYTAAGKRIRQFNVKGTGGRESI